MHVKNLEIEYWTFAEDRDDWKRIMRETMASLGLLYPHRPD